ncbi:retron St85 family effector protein [Mesorhizobium sp. M0118]|uniref:retron St85 family effector protein n=1 Tax=Mesorhizobium sp. M0118 TaxID=2956884 RepID=UPI00333DEE4E
MIAGGDIADLVERFDASTLRVRAPTPIILLCGGQIDVKTAKPNSLRDAYTQIYGRPGLKSYSTVTPEDFRIFAPDGPYKDWLSFEREFAQIVDLVVLFSESYGSVAELGAFSVVEEIATRLLVVIDDKNYSDPSFIKLGPLLFLQENHGKSTVCVLNRQDLNINNINSVADVSLDRLAEALIPAIEKRKAEYREHTTFNPERAGHVIKLIVGLIQHYGALTEDEIDILLYVMDLKVPFYKIADYLSCAINACWIVRDKRGISEYYCALPDMEEAVTYRLRKDLPPDEKDRARWRARVIEYWKNKEPVRFSSIQTALKSAL